MVGAYTTVMSGLWLHTGILIAIPLAFLVTALIGLMIERVIVRRLYGDVYKRQTVWSARRRKRQNSLFISP